MKKQLFGTVVSDKMNKTAIVLVERFAKHPIYKKYIRRWSKFAVHDPENICNIGDRVTIVESKPISKTKRWIITNVVQKAD